jgi:hypothetical protein
VEAAQLPWLRLGALLMREGLLTPQQLGQALLERDESGKRIGEIVVEHGWVTTRDLAKALAEQQGLLFLDLHEAEIDRELAARLPENLARRYRALPVRLVDDDLVLVAVADPTNVATSDDLRLAFGSNVRLAVAEDADLENAIRRVYRKHVEFDEAEEEAAEAEAVAE